MPSVAGPGAPDPQVGPTVALACLTVVSTLAFSRVFTTAGWLASALGCAVGGHALAWWLRRRRAPPVVALIVGLTAVGLLACYLVLPGDLTWGLPAGHLYHGLGAALRQAGDGMRSAITPVPSAPGYSVLVAWGAGAAALFADFLAFRLHSSLQALAPAFALFLTASAIGTARGRGWTVGAEVAAISMFLLVERTAAQRTSAAWLGGRAPSTSRLAVRAGAASAAVAVVAAVALTPAIPSREGDGVLGWRDAPGSGNGTRITPSPFDDLRTRLLDNPDTVVMTVTSSQPSYWRLTSLDDFDGTVWSSDDSYQSAGGRLPGVKLSPGTEQVTEQFQIAALDSIWLPTGFDPEAVHHITGVSWDPASGSLISSDATSNGQTYTVEAAEQLAQLSPGLLAATPALSTSELPPGELTLPTNIPASVLALARKITAGATTEYAKAYALEQYFHQPPFTYTTDPPSDDSTSALATFLFTTHAGYCQQFAGAYAVLARAVGLPTRIAVGFQSGTAVGGEYTVTDADAHAWPEVWFPTVGWVPFEPTPGRQVPGASYTGNTSSLRTSSSTTTPTTTSPTKSTPVGRQKPTTHVPSSATPATPKVAPHHHSNSWPLVGLAVALVALIAVGWSGAVVMLRRLRWRRRRNRALRLPRGDPALSPPTSEDDWRPLRDHNARQRVLVAWAETAELLAWWQLRRRADETVREFADRAAVELMRRLAVSERTVAQLQELAGLVQAAEFSRMDMARAEADRADRLAQEVMASLRRATPRGRRLEHLIDPRQALRPVVVESSS